MGMDASRRRLHPRLPTIPGFSGMVIHHITKQINSRLPKEVITRVRKKCKIDDERGAVPIVMGYVDNANALVTIEDAAEYLLLCEEIGGQLGAILNTEEKTIILTSTSGTSLVEQMINSNNPDTQTRGQLLKKT